MTDATISKLNAAADAYAVAESDEQRTEALMAVMEWLSYSYEEDGMSDEDLNGMDIESSSLDYIERRRTRGGCPSF